jgi:hypothetical protein
MVEDRGLQETDEPWKEPGQTSQDTSIQPPENAVEQQKNKKGVKPGVPSPINPDSRVHS